MCQVEAFLLNIVAFKFWKASMSNVSLIIAARPSDNKNSKIPLQRSALCSAISAAVWACEVARPADACAPNSSRALGAARRNSFARCSTAFSAFIFAV
jgi:hypothetical protein